MLLRAHRSAWAGVWLCAAPVMGCAPALAASASCHDHTAVAGDTLIALAQRYLAKPGQWQALSRVNHIGNPRRLPVGAVLCIPVDLMKATPRPGVVLEVVGEASLEPPAAGNKLSPGKKQAPPAPLPAHPVRQGDAIPAGTTLRTGGDGYVTVQLADGSILKVQADTQARLDSSQQYEEAGFFASAWSVLRGRVESLVAHLTGGQPRYQIKTPQATLGVRGTEFRVSTNAQRTTSETLSGTVAVSNGKQTTVIQGGQGTIAATHAAVEAAAPLPPAPVLDGLPTLYERPLIRLDLPTVPGAASYRVRIAEDADFRRVRAEASSAQPRFRIADLPDGPYHLHVRVANAQGLEGMDASTTFRLKARPEPPLATGPADKGKVRGQEAKFSWTTHPQAQAYRLQVARDTAFTQLVLEQADIADTHFTLSLSPGDYHWRVATTAAATPQSQGTPDKGPWGDAQLLLMREPPAVPPPPQITADSLLFHLQAEPGQRFEFQMAADAAFTASLAEVASSQPDVSMPRPPEGGRWYVRYRAIDADGFIGPYTAPQIVLLPQCVRSSDQQCVMGGERFLITAP